MVLYEYTSVSSKLKLLKMKKSIIILSSIVSLSASAQVAIGKGSITNNNPSISLEFGDYDGVNGRGIIVPWVKSAGDVTGAIEGTIVYDSSDKVLKYKNGNNSWFGLSKNEITKINGANVDTTGKVVTIIQDGLDDKVGAKAAIGTSAASDTNPGILVLSDDNRAMVLPKVPEPHKNIVNPEPGTMVYDTTNKMVAIFNGKVWSFWKP